MTEPEATPWIAASLTVAAILALLAVTSTIGAAQSAERLAPIDRPPVSPRTPEIVLELPDIPTVSLALPQMTTREIVAWRLEQHGRIDEFDCLDRIFQGESSWRPDAVGDNGDSFGLGQRNAPAHGASPWPWPVPDQVDWFLQYADDRYGGPCPARDVWQRRADQRGGAGWW